jgi:hypothetical protein
MREGEGREGGRRRGDPDGRRLTVQTGSIEAIVQTLWAVPGDEVYAVLDAARDPLVRAKLVASDVRSACLYEGRIPRELAEVAPYLVKLRRDHRFTEQLLESGWGRSWGVFASTPADFESVRRHFRRFLRVEDESGKTMIFRWYDPRVLRAYLPTCTERELDMLFGPLSAYHAEDEEPRRLNVYSRRGSVFAMSRVTLPG